MNAPKQNYPEPSKVWSQEDNVAYIPESLYLFLGNLCSETNADITIVYIEQAIIQAARQGVLIAPLQIWLAILCIKVFINILSKVGLSSSCTEIL